MMGAAGDPAGRITEHPLADPAGEPDGLVFGPGGTLYVAEERGVVSRWDVVDIAGPNERIPRREG
ncbi:hypothetical protein ACFWBC_32505 [Streptomyces sp. NPDC059985]|uniref:hypothetical protein n=1 Tax=Streptomyces sp. NPDC059985 TaxID=3347025 RepID=UPI0036B8215B